MSRTPEEKPLDQEAREIIVKHALWDAGFSGEQSAERGPVMLKVFELIEAARKEGVAAAQEELRIQDEANEILTRQMEDLTASHARLRGLMYPPREISEWRKWAACCNSEESGDAADQAIAKCTQYFRSQIETTRAQLAVAVDALEKINRFIEYEKTTPGFSTLTITEGPARSMARAALVSLRPKEQGNS